MSRRDNFVSIHSQPHGKADSVYSVDPVSNCPQEWQAI
jgi:hypothetical protein